MNDRILISYYLTVFILVLLALGAFTANADSKTYFQISSSIREIAEQEGIDPELALAIAKVESRLDPNAIGGIGEVGVFQLRPDKHKVDKGNVQSNIRTAMKYLKQVKKICEPNYGEAWFICYNTGEYYRKKNGELIQYPKQFPYYVKVKREMNKIAMK
jgi:soluble lytic murein transglycosylase-like protein